jgi:cytidyltransferase-like protein
VSPGLHGESLVCVSGRFQPVHDDHLRLFRTALAAGDRLVVAVTNPDPGARRAEPTSEHRHRADANPFTYYERVELLTAALAGEEGLGAERAAQVRIVPFDLARPEHWSHYVPLAAVQYVGVYGPWEQEKVRRLAAGGYRVVEVRGEEATRRSATAIRSAVRAGQDWEQLVPPSTVAPLRMLLARRSSDAGSAR